MISNKANQRQRHNSVLNERFFSTTSVLACVCESLCKSVYDVLEIAPCPASKYISWKQISRKRLSGVESNGATVILTTLTFPVTLSCYQVTLPGEQPSERGHYWTLH